MNDRIGPRSLTLAILAIPAMLAGLAAPPLAAPEMMKPGEAHRRLDFMVGAWEVLSKGHMGNRVHQTTREAEIAWLPDGVWLDERSEAFESPIGPMHGTARIAWDERAQEYVRHWTDNQSVVVLSQRGKFVDERTLEFRGSFTWVDGTTFHERLVIRSDPEGGFSHTGYMGRDPESLRLNHEAVYRPAAAGGAAPEWLRRHMEFMTNDGGRFITDNSAYRTDDSPWDAFGLEWKWGVGKQSLVGRLFGLVDGVERATFWEFRTFWNPAEARAELWQFGGNGVVGSGTLVPDGENRTRLLQTFQGPGGRRSEVGHESIDAEDGSHVTTSFDVGPDGVWKTRRSYVWKRSPAPKETPEP